MPFIPIKIVSNLVILGYLIYYLISIDIGFLTFFFCNWFLTIKAAAIAAIPNTTLAIANICPPSINLNQLLHMYHLQDQESHFYYIHIIIYQFAIYILGANFRLWCQLLKDTLTLKFYFCNKYKIKTELQTHYNI